MTAEEYGIWAAEYARAPWGEVPAWQRMGVLASMYANVHKASDSARYSPADFMPSTDAQAEEEIDAEEFIRRNYG